jgi:methionine sulfoxide reductase heme-binding subunit
VVLTRRVLKPIVFITALLPTAWLVWAAFTNHLGANPAETLQLQTGRWALRLLLATLTVTPLRRLTGWNDIIRFRRMLGLFAFYYASLHFLTYLVLDQYFDWSGIVRDIAKRPFITAGFAAFVLMTPLALTSTKGWIRRLGRRWQTLHRLIYASAICAAVHFIWKVKVVVGDPVLYAAILAVLLGFRVLWRVGNRSVQRGARPVRPSNLPVH